MHGLAARQSFLLLADLINLKFIPGVSGMTSLDTVPTKYSLTRTVPFIAGPVQNKVSFVFPVVFQPAP